MAPFQYQYSQLHTLSQSLKLTDSIFGFEELAGIKIIKVRPNYN